MASQCSTSMTALTSSSKSTVTWWSEPVAVTDCLSSSFDVCKSGGKVKKTEAEEAETRRLTAWSPGSSCHRISFIRGDCFYDRQLSRPCSINHYHSPIRTIGHRKRPNKGFPLFPFSVTSALKRLGVQSYFRSSKKNGFLKT